MSYGQASRYYWIDDEGRTHTVTQAEGGEQGDPLMPALYALGQHRALEQAAASLHAEDLLLESGCIKILRSNQENMN